MIGRVYIDPGRKPRGACEGRPRRMVRVLIRWAGRGPRNVLVEPVQWVCAGLGPVPDGEPKRVALKNDFDGVRHRELVWVRPELVRIGKPYVRPFRGLRRVA